MSWSSRDRRAVFMSACSGIAPLVAAMTGASANAQMVPRIEVDVSTLVSNNPLLVAGGDRGGIQGEISIKPGLSLTTPTGSTFDLAAVITDRQYSQRYGNFVVGNVAATGSYRDSEYLSVGASLSAARDLAVDLLTTEVDAVADPSSIRTSYNSGLSLTWHPDQYTWVRPDVTVETANYSDTTLLRSTRAVTGSLAYIRRVSERTRVGARAGATFSRTAGLSDISTQSLLATVERRLSTGWRASGEIGGERSSARSEDWFGLLRVNQPARVLVSGRAELCRDAVGPTLCVSGSLNSEVSGLGGLQRRAVLSASASKALSERNTFAFVGEYRRATTQGGALPPLDAIRAVATLERRLNPTLTLAGTLQYLRRQQLTGARIGAGFAGLELRYRPVLR